MLEFQEQIHYRRANDTDLWCVKDFRYQAIKCQVDL